MMMKKNTTSNLNIGYVNTRISKTGCSNFNCLRQKKTKPIHPSKIGIYTIGARNPASWSLTELNPKTMPPNPIVDSKIDTQSIFGFVTSETLIKYLYANAMENIANGMTKMNK